MEIDWSVGQILAALRKNGLDEETLVVFTSDNGPWLLYGNHAGSALPLREGKATTFDGGLREPCIMRWPGKIPAGRVCREVAATMDLLPTIARLTGARLPDHTIDGRDIQPLMTETPGAKSPHAAYFYYWDRELQAVRSGPWKLHFPHNYPKPEPPGGDGKPGNYATKTIAAELFNLEQDIAESKDVAALHPDIVKKLEGYAAQCREDLGDSRTRQTGRNARPPGRLESAATPAPAR
jgi:arylsulfatase